MSIYSGFATRQLETNYFVQIGNLIKLLQKRILKFYNNELADEGVFRQLLQQTYKKMSAMEENKYLQPYFSNHITDLCQYLNFGNKLDFHTQGTTTGSQFDNSLGPIKIRSRLQTQSEHTRQIIKEFKGPFVIAPQQLTQVSPRTQQTTPRRRKLLRQLQKMK